MQIEIQDDCLDALARGVASQLRDAANEWGYHGDTDFVQRPLPNVIRDFRRAYTLAQHRAFRGHAHVKDAVVYAQPQIDELASL